MYLSFQHGANNVCLYSPMFYLWANFSFQTSKYLNAECWHNEQHEPERCIYRFLQIYYIVKYLSIYIGRIYFTFSRARRLIYICVSCLSKIYFPCIYKQRNSSLQIFHLYEKKTILFNIFRQLNMLYIYVVMGNIQSIYSYIYIQSSMCMYTTSQL